MNARAAVHAAHGAWVRAKGNLSLGLAAIAATSLCAVGCLDIMGGPRAGGTIETTNGIISAQVVLPNGQGASNIKIFRVDEQDWLAKVKADETVILDSVETDTSGKFTFSKVDTSHACGLVADVEGYGFLIHNVSQKLIQDSYNGKIGLSKKVSYQGTIKDPHYVAKRIYLSGSPYSADVDTAGNFVIKDVPENQYTVVIERQLPDQEVEFVVGDQVTLNQWTEGKPVTIVPDTAKSVLLENFDDNDNRNLLGPVLGGGYWDALNDYPDGNSILLQPANAAAENWPKGIKDGGFNSTGDHSHALQVLYTQGTHPGTYAAYPYVVMTMNIGLNGHAYNFGSLDSLAFSSAGTGKVVVELVQEGPGNGVSLEVVASKTITLDTNTWNRYVIKVSDLAVAVNWFPEDPASLKQGFLDAGLPPYTQKPASWSDMQGKITQIRFKGTGGGEFWLDDIRVYGLSADDLVK